MELRARPGRRPDAARLVRGVRDRGGDDPCPAAPAGLVLAQVAAGLPVRRGVALSVPAPHSDRPWAVAGEGGEAELLILAVHVRGLDGMCAGCLAWWSRLSPYPCWQVEWATSRQARSSTVRFLGGRR